MKNNNTLPVAEKSAICPRSSEDSRQYKYSANSLNINGKAREISRLVNKYRPDWEGYDSDVTLQLWNAIAQYCVYYLSEQEVLLGLTGVAREVWALIFKPKIDKEEWL